MDREKSVLQVDPRINSSASGESEGNGFVRKAIFFDIDGTLVGGSNPPTQRVVNAIRRVRRMGHLVFICSGRVPCHFQKSVMEIGFDGVVGAAGAYVAVGSKVIYDEFIDRDIVIEVAREYGKTGNTMVFEGENRLYIISGKNISREGHNSCDAVDFEAGGRFENERIYKFCGDGKFSPEFSKKLSGRALFIGHENFHEIIPAHIGKAVGMRYMLEEWGVEQENSIAIGDSSNDIDMLKFAGTGIAMGDSPEHVRSMADKITAEFHKDGVAVALETLFP